MSKTLQGKVAVCNRRQATGIGFAIARAFVAEGAYVFITGRRQAVLDEAVAEIGENVQGLFRADSSNLDDLDALFETVRDDKGRIDVLVANAGGGVSGALGLDYRGGFSTPTFRDET